jgi:hypothetical protein
MIKCNSLLCTKAHQRNPAGNGLYSFPAVLFSFFFGQAKKNKQGAMSIKSIKTLKALLFQKPYLCKKPMNKPLIRSGCIVMPRTKQPVSFALFIFHCIIIPVLPILQPPFLFYPFRSIRLFYFM